MILEAATLSVRPGQAAEFETAFREAQRIVASIPGYLSHELGRCIERPDEFLLLVRWTSVDAHEIGFRQSKEYQQWKLLLHRFYDPFPVVSHYTRVGEDSKQSPVTCRPVPQPAIYLAHVRAVLRPRSAA